MWRNAVSRGSETKPECEYDKDNDEKSVDNDKQPVHDEHTRARDEHATDTDARSRKGRCLETG